MIWILRQFSDDRLLIIISEDYVIQNNQFDNDLLGFWLIPIGTQAKSNSKIHSKPHPNPKSWVFSKPTANLICDYRFFMGKWIHELTISLKLIAFRIMSTDNIVGLLFAIEAV